MVTQQELEEATRRGEESHKTLPHAVDVRFDRQSRMIVMELNWGYTVSFPPERSQDLHEATLEELSEVEISGLGQSIYFPRLDTDLWVPGMVCGVFGNKRWESEWAAKNNVDDASLSYRQSFLIASGS